MAEGAAAKPKPSARQHAVAGQAAGALSTLCFYPLDVIKTRFMAQDGTAVRAHNGANNYRHVLPAIRVIVQEEGPLGMLRGAHVAVGAATVSWGMYMYTYRALDELLKARWHDVVASVHVSDAALGGSLSSSAVAGIAAGATVNVATNPFWLIKARMQLRRQDEPARSLVGTVRDAVARDGIRSLWRGTPAQILAGVPNSLQYPVYEASRRGYRTLCAWSDLDIFRHAEHRPGAKAVGPGWGEVTVCTLTTKMALGALSHPVQLVKARLMDWRSRDGAVRYESTVQAARTIFQREGVWGFYRGITVGFMHTVPRTIMQFQLYEAALSATHGRFA